MRAWLYAAFCSLRGRLEICVSVLLIKKYFRSCASTFRVLVSLKTLKGSFVGLGRVGVRFLYAVARICALGAGLDETSCPRSGVVVIAGVDEEAADCSGCGFE